MKKILSLLLCVILSFSAVTGAFAAEVCDGLFTALNKMNASFEATAEMSIKLDKPLKIADVIASYIKQNNDAGFEPFGLPSNLRTLTESVFGTETQADMAFSVSDDFKKIRCEVKSETLIPLIFSESFKNVSEVSEEMWLEFDFSDMSNPIYKIVQKTPLFGDKYAVIDMASILGEDFGEFAEVMNLLLNPAVIKEIQNGSFELMKKHGEITKKGNTYTLHFSDSGAKAYIAEIIKLAFDIEKTFDTELLPSGDVFETVTNALDKIKIFGDKGINAVYTVSGGKITSCASEVSFDLNVYDIISTFAPEALQVSDEPFITKENSEIAFTLTGTANYKNLGKSVNVVLPELTEENSFDVSKMLFGSSAYAEIEEETTFATEYYYGAGSGGYLQKNGYVYLPLRAVFNAYGVEDGDVIWDNGKITVESNGACPYFDEIVCSVSDNFCILNGGTEIYLNEPLISANGITYISTEFIKSVFGGKIEYVEATINDIDNPDDVSVFFTIINENTEGAI